MCSRTQMTWASSCSVPFNLHKKLAMEITSLSSLWEETEAPVSGKLVMCLCRPCMEKGEYKSKRINKVLFPRL